MPRPRLSSAERQRRKNQRLARWRAQVPASSVALEARQRVASASQPFVYAQPGVIQSIEAPEPPSSEEELDDDPFAVYDTEMSDAEPALGHDRQRSSLSLSPASPEPHLGQGRPEIEAQRVPSRAGPESGAIWGGDSASPPASPLQHADEPPARPELDGRGSGPPSESDGTKSFQASDSDGSDGLEDSDSDGSDADGAIDLDAELQREIRIREQADRVVGRDREEADDEVETDLAEALGQHLVQFNGCDAATHEEAARQHTVADPGPNRQRHVSLAGYTSQLCDAHVPVVIDQPGFLTTTDREQHRPPNWRQIFEGREAAAAESAANQGRRSRDSSSDSALDRDQERDELCLTCSELGPRSALVTFDIDSFLGFARSLAFARQGLDLNLYPRFYANIQTDLHLYLTVYHDYGRGEKPARVKLQKVPHYCAGRVLGHEDMALYVFFPRMYDPDKATNFPGSGSGETHELLRVWTDSVLIPAIFRHVPATSRQHFPHSWEHARHKAEAYHAERSTRTSLDTRADQVLSLHYALHPLSLAAIWQDVEQQLTDPQYLIYRGARLFFSSKNTKLRFPYHTLSDVWQAFERPLSAAVDLAYVQRDEVWLDLGKEVSGLDYALASERLGDDSVPTTYLFRTCCLESWSQWASLGEPGRPVIPTLYAAAMLRDAGDMTLEMSRSSRQRREGWVFSQAYNGYKELFDAAKTKPFSNPYLSQLTWDPAVARMIQTQGRAVLAPDSKLRRSYQASKRRLSSSLAGGSTLSYGVREEHRISLAFFERMRSRLEAAGDWDRALSLTAADSRHIRPLSTAEYLAYLGHNANKYMAAFEWILTLDTARRVSFEHCKVMTMLLQALPFAFDSGPIMRQRELWQTRFQRRRGGPQVLGMGMHGTLARHGYMWFLPRVDWEAMAFRPRLASDMAFSRSMLRENYWKHGLRVRDSKEDYARVEAAGRWLSHYGSSQECRDIIYGFLILLLIRAYRKEVYAYLKPQFKPDDPARYEEAATGVVPLCAATLQRLLTPESLANQHIVDGNRTKIRSVEALVSLLWDFRDQDRVERGQWESMAFRVLCQRASELVEEHCGAGEQAMFHDSVKRYFIATNWLVPYPRAGKFFQKTQDKESMWMAVYHRRLAYSRTRPQRKLSLSLILNTVKAWPTRCRPTSVPWPVPEEASASKEYRAVPKRVKYMPDWDVCGGDTRPLMQQTPVERVEDYLRPGASLEAAGQALERAWELSRPAEGE